MNNTSRPPSWQVVAAVAAYYGTDPTELTPRLAEVIDPDALDTLLESPDVEVRLRYLGLEIRVSSASGVSILHEVEQ